MEPHTDNGALWICVVLVAVWMILWAVIGDIINAFYWTIGVWLVLVFIVAFVLHLRKY